MSLLSLQVKPDPPALEVRPAARATPNCELRNLASSGSAPSACSARASSPHDEAVARQKALFVSETLSLARSQKVSLQHAAHLVAAQTDLFPDLVTAGKRGSSLLAEKSAWHNFRSWSAILNSASRASRPSCSKSGVSDSWKALLYKCAGSRDYERPGDPQFWPVLASLYEGPNKYSLRYSYKLACLAFRKTPSADSAREIPSYAQVRHYYDRHADQKAVIIAREGEEHFRNNLAGYIRRDAPAPDECWFSDHHLFDAAVKVWDPDHGCWKAARPWLTAWLDWGALYFAGVLIRAAAPDRNAIERCLRSGLDKNQLHPPVRLYVDNGKDYRAMGLARPLLDENGIARLQSVAQLLGCRAHFALPYNARAKVIERIFGIVCGQFSKLWPSYRGRNPQERPEHAAEAWKDAEKLPTLEQFAAAFERWLAMVYHDAPSEGKILDGKSPAQVRAGMRHPRPALDPPVVYRAFLRELPQPRLVMRGGVVRALNREYESQALWRILDGKTQVRVKVDPDDVSVAYIFDLQGREIGPAKAVQRLPAFVEDKESVERLKEAMQKQRRQINEAKRISAANRDLSRFSPRQLPASGALFDAGPSPCRAVGPAKADLAPRSPRAPREPLPPSDPALSAELDSLLRSQTQERLSAAAAPDVDVEDLRLLAEIEAEASR
jgi:hypothetical protein